jgi:hypothetical protein
MKEGKDRAAPYAPSAVPWPLRALASQIEVERLAFGVGIGPSNFRLSVAKLFQHFARVPQNVGAVAGDFPQIWGDAE